MTQRTNGINTRRWNYRCSLGRWQFGLRVLRHRYARVSDRWVVQPEVIYDRKAKP